MKSNGANLFQSLKKIPYLLLISHLARKNKVNIWLLGGALRDIYIRKDKELFDFDFCVEKETLSLAKEFAKKISAKFIILDKNQESYRVIFKKKDKRYSYDFTRLRGKDFKEDLSLRDFSINTLAVNLKESKIKLIDYFGARGDLKRKMIRVIKNEVISADPLRILRAFAFAANYRFKIQPKTLKVIVRFKQSLKEVSPERINEELFKILSPLDSVKTISLMNQLKVIDEFIPYFNKTRRVFQGAYHHLDVCKHSIETLKQFELLYRKKLIKNKEILAYLNCPIAKNRQRLQIIKLACLLHDIGKPLAKNRIKKKTIFYAHEKIGRDLADEAANLLRLSFREKEVLKKLIFWHLRPGYLADQERPTKRAIYRFFRDTEEEGIAVIILSLSDWRATRGPQTSATKRKKHEKIMLKLINDYLADQKKKPLPKIIDGYDIMKKFKIKPSPLVGQILKKIREEQALGKISTKRQGYQIARKIIPKAKRRSQFKKAN